MKKQIKITDINPEQESFSVPEGYFENLNAGLHEKIKNETPFTSIEQLPKQPDTFKIPEGYFNQLETALVEAAKNDEENNVVAFKSKRIKFWGSMVAAACIAMIIISIFQFGNNSQEVVQPYAESSIIKRIPDDEIAALLQDRDDEFELTEDEILEVIVHETKQTETDAIINFLEEDADINGSSQDDFFESI